MTKTTRVIIGTTLAAGLAVGATACGSSGGNSGAHSERSAQRQIENRMAVNQPIPVFGYSQIRQNLIEVETAQAQGVRTTSFFFNQGVADPIEQCSSIGAPIATTTQLSNPAKTVEGNGNGEFTSIPQMDPNGTYTGGSSGTYVMCLDAHGKPYAHYWEGFVSTVFASATWDKATHSVNVLGAPTFDFSKGKK